MKKNFNTKVIQKKVLTVALLMLAMSPMFAQGGATAISMMTRFMAEWTAETAKWIDAQIKVAAAESAENKAQISAWVSQYRSATLDALKPLAVRAFGDQADAILGEVLSEFNARCKKAGLTVQE